MAKQSAWGSAMRSHKNIKRDGREVSGSFFMLGLLFSQEPRKGHDFCVDRLSSDSSSFAIDVHCRYFQFKFEREVGRGMRYRVNRKLCRSCRRRTINVKSDTRSSLVDLFKLSKGFRAPRQRSTSEARSLSRVTAIQYKVHRSKGEL